MSKYWKLTAFILAVVLCVQILPGTARAEETAPPHVNACSAVLLDYETGEILFEKDADTMRVPASMTKVMTTYLVFEELEAGNLTLDTLVPVSEHAAEISRDKHYPSNVPLPAGGTLTVSKLLELILVPSASASCIVIAEYISGSEAAFVQRMNDTAARLGLTAAYENCHGAMPHYITARSQALLVWEFIRRFPQVLDYTALTSVEFDGETYPNTNRLLPGLSYAYEGADGFKTGTIKAAGYCLSATAVRNGHRLISVVMHSEDTETRHTDSIALLDYGFQLLEARPAAGNQNIEVDGIEVNFPVCVLKDADGNGTNYVKLRDVAYVLRGTEAQFSVDYQGETGVLVTTGIPYQSKGLEMERPLIRMDKGWYVQDDLMITVNGVPVPMNAITLVDEQGGGYNYIKLRDLGAALGFTVDWSAQRGVYIETAK